MLQYSEGNVVRLKHKASGQNIYAKPNGGLFVTGARETNTETFELSIINRPTLILRGQYGFLGQKGASGRVECNRSTPDVFKLESKGGEYFISAGGKYWTVDQDGVAVAAARPVPFYLEFVQHSKVLVKHKETQRYLQGEQNGG